MYKIKTKSLARLPPLKVRYIIPDEPDDMTVLSL